MSSYSNVGKVIRAVPRAVKNPVRAAKLFHRRVMPVGLSAKDPEAKRLLGWSYGEAPRVDLRDIFPGIETADIVAFNSYDRTRDLSLDAQEVLALMAIVAHTKPKKILEIGTSDGNTTLNLIANAPKKAHITTFDLPEDWDGDYEIKLPGIMDNMTDRAVVGRQYKESKYKDQVTQVLGDSAVVDYNELDGPFDLIFIDGCHYYEYVKKDTENSLAHVAKGGTIVWHDYGMLEDVCKAVDPYLNDMDIKVVAGTRLAIARMPG